MATNLTKTIAVTETAYNSLVSVSKMTGMPIGELASLAIDAFIEDKTAKMRENNRSVILGDRERVSSQNRG